jgi:solute carrier family 25 carnitine/acylcarnitine transporter 20/29
MEEVLPTLDRRATSSIRINSAHAEEPSPAVSPSPSLALHELIAGGVAGSAGIFVGHPLDTLKVRMQMLPAGSSLFNSQYGSVWKGVGAPVTMAAVLNAQIFLVYGRSTRLWNDYFNLQKDESSMLRDAVCGGFTGLMSALIMCPTEHVKTRLQTQHKSNITLSTGSNEVIYRNGLHATRHIFENYGIAGLFRGTAATALRQSPSFGVYFAVYNHFKDVASDSYQKDSLLISMAAGGFAGSLSWAVVYPVDLIKSRIQAMPFDSKVNHSIGAMARQFVQENGWRALYRGFWLTVIRAFPVNGVIFPTYEVTLRALKQN